jgi:hypothetical protein
MVRCGAAAAVVITQIASIAHTTPKTYRAKVTRFSLSSEAKVGEANV